MTDSLSPADVMAMQRGNDDGFNAMWSNPRLNIWEGTLSSNT